jgi:L,D-peptidoglycan transpeptidase YkuD (ErfK/YbiS/YcfS/YnhG family)
VIGANGLAAEGEKREGDKKTPAGLFPLRRAFGRYMFCPSRLPYVRMSKNDIWIDDPSSPDYNTLVKGESTYSHEKMLRADGLYDYGVVIEYNTIDIEPNKGSAIFMHVWRDVDSPTAGCVAVSRAHMMQMLSWLESAKKPAILLGEDLPEKKKSADEPTYDVSTAGS